MEHLEIVKDIIFHPATIPAALSASFLVTLNIGTFLYTRKWFLSHSGQNLSWYKEWYEKNYENVRNPMRYRQFIVRYLGYPGRTLAVELYSKRSTNPK